MKKTTNNALATIATTNTNTLATLKSVTLETVKRTKAERSIDFRTATFQSFKLDIQDKSVREMLARFEVSMAFETSLKADLADMANGADIEDANTVATLEYYRSVCAIACAKVERSLKPLYDTVSAIQKMLTEKTEDRLTHVNNAMKAAFKCELSESQLSVLAGLNVTASKAGMKEKSASAFRNAFLWLMIECVSRSGAYSPKLVKGVLNNVMNDVETISAEQFYKMDTATVDYLIKTCDIRVKKSDTFIFKADKVRKAAGRKYAVKPETLEIKKAE